MGQYTHCNNELSKKPAKNFEARFFLKNFRVQTNINIFYLLFSCVNYKKKTLWDGYMQHL